ncbi:hypothetical protein ACFMJ9_19120, partial [Acinetobacter baumannii]
AFPIHLVWPTLPFMPLKTRLAIYCGVPAAVDSFRIAKEAIKEFESEQ